MGKPQVAYKETITKEGNGMGKYIRQTGGRGQYGHCELTVKPLKVVKGTRFVNAIKGASIPNEFILAIEKGLKEAKDKGVYAGYPWLILSNLTDGSYHEVDSRKLPLKLPPLWRCKMP